jgi:HNH endonuclease
MTPHEQTLSLCPYCGQECRVGFGFCHCGCKSLTTISPVNRFERGILKGNPVPYISGHNRVQLRLQVEQPIDTNLRRLALTQGQSTLLNVFIYEPIKHLNWCAKWDDHTQSFYAMRRSPRMNGKQGYAIYLHREILGLEVGDPVKGDHRNGDTLDNRIENLRWSDNFQSAQNRGDFINITSGCKGVHWANCWGQMRWHSTIGHNGKVIHLGWFDNYEEACIVRKSAEIFYHREFSRNYLNALSSFK